MYIGLTRDERVDLDPLPRDCPCCGAARLTAAVVPYGANGWVLRKCGDCAMVFVDRHLPYENLEKEHAWEVSSKAEDARRAEARPISYKASKLTRRRLSWFKRRDVVEDLRLHVTSGNVIDLGCGDGAQVARLPDPIVPHGIEVSEVLAAQAAARLQPRGGMVVQGTCLAGLQQLRPGFLSGAILRSYLEHEAYPLDVLRALHRAMAPGAVAIVKVPNYATVNRIAMGRRWCGFRFPDHLNQFTPRTLMQLASRAGFGTVMRVRDRLWTSDNLYAVLIRQSVEGEQWPSGQS